MAAVRLYRIAILALALVIGFGAVAFAPPALAEDNVTYEIVSRDIGIVNIEYTDNSGRVALQQVPLPWRTSVVLADAKSPERDGAEVRTDWRPQATRYRWVTVRIYQGDALICEITMNVGNATCYGSTPSQA